MAYLLRSLAIIGVIAFNSPVQSGKPTLPDMADTVRHATKSAAQIDMRGAMQSVTAAREAAQILADLDPETRQRVLKLALPAASPAAEKPERTASARLR